MSLILKHRLPVKKLLLDEQHTKHQVPQFQNQYKHYMDWQGNFLKTWQQPTKSAYDRPIKKFHYDVRSDTRSIWPKR